MSLFNIYTWGHNLYYQCGIETPDIIQQPTLVNNNSYKKVAPGYYHNLTIDNNDNLYGWGRNEQYQLGLNHNNNLYDITNINNTNTWIDIDAGRYHSVAIDHTNNLYYWGNICDRIIKEPELLDSDIIKAKCGNLFIAYINNNKDLYVIGTINYSQFRLETDSYAQTRDGRTGPLRLFKHNEPFHMLSNVEEIYCSSNHIIAIDSDNKKYVMGYHPLVEYEFTDQVTNLSRKFKISSTSFNLIPDYTNFIPENILKITSKSSHSLLLDTDSKLYGLGNNFHKELDDIDNRKLNKFIDLDISNVSDISAGNNHSLILLDDKIYSQGLNNYNQCNDSNSYIINGFTLVDELNNYDNIYCGLDFNIATKTI